MPRKQNNIHYLYKTTCNVTGRYYIGMHSTINLEDGYLGSGKRLRYSIRKHGEENHIKEILEFFETRELLVEAEINAINEDMIDDNNCMNLQLGDGGFSSEEHRLKANKSSRESFKKRLNEDEEFRKSFIEHKRDHFKKLWGSGKFRNNKNFLGKKHTPETKLKMSESSKGVGTGKTNSQYGTMWITKDGLNKKIKKEVLPDYEQQGWVKGRC